MYEEMSDVALLRHEKAREIHLYFAHKYGPLDGRHVGDRHLLELELDRRRVHG
jgi:hypothetical protein